MQPANALPPRAAGSPAAEEILQDSSEVPDAGLAAPTQDAIDLWTGFREFAARSGPAGAILADPALRFKTWSEKGEGRSPQHHYACLTFEQLATLPMRDLAAADSWLFLWMPLRSAPAVDPLMNAWGFRFSGSGFVWAKQNPKGQGFAFGGGFTTRKNVEVCWLGRRGKPRRNAKDVRELIIARRRQHSRKPDEIYPRIEGFCDGPYVELFARQRWPGWLAWGDQIDSFTAAVQVGLFDSLAQSPAIEESCA
jgi:N6-adenosine-specific RNA methylase IME4